MADQITIDEKDGKELLATIRAIQKKVDDQGKYNESFAQLEANTKELIERQDKLEAEIKAKDRERKLSFTLGQMHTDPVLRGIEKAAKIPASAVEGKRDEEIVKSRGLAFTEALSQPTQDDEIKRFKQLSADLYFVWNVMKSCRDFRGDITALDTYRRWKEMFIDITKATPIQVQDTASEFAAWIPTGMANTAIEAPLVVGNVEPIFPHVSMSSPIYKHPTDIVSPTQMPDLIPEAYTTGQTNTDAYGNSLLATAITLTASKIRSRYQFSFEAAEDSIIAARPNVEKKLGIIMKQGVEGIILNGDTTATHMDTDIEALGAYDCRTIAKGIRKYAIAAADPYLRVDLSSFSEASIRAMRAKMDVYSDENEVVIIVSPKVYLKMFNATSFPSFATQAVFGMSAFNTTGRMPSIDGMEIIRSQQSRNDTNATQYGINYTSGNTTAVLHMVNKNYFFLGERRLPTLAVDIWNQTEVVNISLFRRLDFEPFATPSATTYPLCVLGYGIA